MLQSTSQSINTFIPCWAFFCDEGNETIAAEHATEDEAVKNILTKDEREFLILRVDKMVESWLKNSITETQLRILYNVLNAPKVELNKIRIQLIYIASRQNNPAVKSFVELTKALLDKRTENNKVRIVDFIESVLSHYKFYSKK